MDMKKAIILIIGVIIGIIIIVNVYPIITAPSVEITDISVEKCGKIYRINYTVSENSSQVLISTYNGEEDAFIADSTGFKGENSIVVKSEKDVPIDKLHFTVHGDSNNIIYSEYRTDFEFKEVNNIPGYTDVEYDTNEDSSSIDSYEIAKSHRDNYDYDHDGFLDDYEFRQWAIGEGQEELLNY